MLFQSQNHSPTPTAEPHLWVVLELKTPMAVMGQRALCHRDSIVSDGDNDSDTVCVCVCVCICHTLPLSPPPQMLSISIVRAVSDVSWMSPLCWNDRDTRTAGASPEKHTEMSRFDRSVG